MRKGWRRKGETGGTLDELLIRYEETCKKYDESAEMTARQSLQKISIRNELKNVEHKAL